MHPAIGLPSDTKEVLVTGSLAFDQIMDFPGNFKDHILPDKIHVINISFLVGDLRKQRGGCAANIAYSLALLGEHPRVVAAAGRDFEQYRDFLTEKGVIVEGIEAFDDEITACCFITTDLADNQITGFHPGAMKRARDLSVKASANDRVKYCIVAPDDPDAMSRHCQEAREAGIPLIFDPSFQVTAMEGETLRAAADGASIVMLNDYELAVFQEKTERDLDGLLKLSPTWIVTLGEHGSRIHRVGHEPIEIPPAKAGEVVDPTGAGDAYRGGLLAGLLRGNDLEACGRMGSVAAVYAIEQYGTQNHEYTQDEFEARYRENFG